MPKITAQDFEDVYSTAQMAHVGQKRRSGEEYFTHPSAVRDIIRKYYPGDKISQLVALLHDTIEDAPGKTVKSAEEMEEFIRGSISNPSISAEVISSVKSLTHSKDQDYTDYVIGLVKKPRVLRVKLADMLHNLSHSPGPKQKAKYAAALVAIEKVSGGIPNGVSKEHWRKLKEITSLKESKTKILKSVIREMIFYSMAKK